MPTERSASNKAKIAKRVIEVLEYFDDSHREATVMDIVRRYNRPQSSTSELLSSLVELGLLHKDPYTRSYSLTARAALLGSNGQTGMLRDGRLVQLIDRLVAQTGLTVAVFGMVGLRSQIVSIQSGPRVAGQAVRTVHGGMQLPLNDTAAGWLLLSTVCPQRRDGMVRRLNAEAPDNRKFSCAEMGSILQQCQQDGTISGPAGFRPGLEVTAALLPTEHADHPLAIGFLYSAEDQVNSASLVACLNEALRQCQAADAAKSGSVEHLASAA